MSPFEDSWDRSARSIPCPTCGATRRRVCRDPDGSVAPDWHAPRKAYARDRWDEEERHEAKLARLLQAAIDAAVEERIEELDLVPRSEVKP